MGNCAGAVAGQIYRTAPYRLGNSFSLGAVCISQCLILTKVFYLKRENAVKGKIEKGEMVDERKIKSGDREVGFKYHI